MSFTHLKELCNRSTEQPFFPLSTVLSSDEPCRQGQRQVDVLLLGLGGLGGGGGVACGVHFLAPRAPIRMVVNHSRWFEYLCDILRVHLLRLKL